MCDLTRRRQASICGCPTSATAKSSLPPDVIFRPAIWAPPTHQARHPQRRGLWACKAPVVLPLRPLFARSFARWAVGPSDIGCVDRSNASHRKPRDLRLDQIDPYCYTQVGKKKSMAVGNGFLEPCSEYKHLVVHFHGHFAGCRMLLNNSTPGTQGTPERPWCHPSLRRLKKRWPPKDAFFRPVNGAKQGSRCVNKPPSSHKDRLVCLRTTLKLTFAHQ